jgi:hypothetical protein
MQAGSMREVRNLKQNEGKDIPEHVKANAG